MTATVVHVERRISATKFKATCLALLDEVAETGETIVVTKHGRPVARVSAVEPPPSLEGSVTFLVSDEELITPLDVEWDAVKGHL
ncbi:MAG: type II toxin-antitoxin system Phd/YefM family antitoxin [Gaiella sp.]